MGNYHQKLLGDRCRQAPSPGTHSIMATATLSYKDFTTISLARRRCRLTRGLTTSVQGLPQEWLHRPPVAVTMHLPKPSRTCFSIRPPKATHRRHSVHNQEMLLSYRLASTPRLHSCAARDRPRPLPISNRTTTLSTTATETSLPCSRPREKLPLGRQTSANSSTRASQQNPDNSSHQTHSHDPSSTNKSAHPTTRPNYLQASYQTATLPSTLSPSINAAFLKVTTVLAIRRTVHRVRAIAAPGTSRAWRTIYDVC